MKSDTLKKLKSSALALILLASPVIAKGETKYYEIKKGDNLIKISKRFYDGNSNYYDELAFFNGIQNPDLIIEGDTLLIPSEEDLINIRKIYTIQNEYFPVDLNNKVELDNKYYSLKKGDTFNKAFELVYGNLFYDYNSLGVSKYELRDALYIYNVIDDPYNLPIGYKVFLLEPNNLVNLTNIYKNEGKLLKKTR